MCADIEQLFGDYGPALGLERREDPLSMDEEGKLGLRPDSWLDFQRDLLKRAGRFALRGGLLGQAFGGPSLKRLKGLFG